MNGIDCFFAGLKLVRQPGIRQYVIVPLLINIVVLTAVLTYGMSQYETWQLALTNWLPDWLQFLSWIIGFLASIVIFTLTIYSFSIIANVIASPFNAVLSEKVQETLTGERPVQNINVFIILGRALGREFSKLLYFLPRLLGLLLLSIIPAVNVIAPFAWILFGAWMMAVQYTDYAADNNQISFKELRRGLRTNLTQALLFGVLVYFFVAIPFLNLILIPVAVAGGTVYWVHWLKDTQ
jgi:CysZ protein